MRNIEDPAQNDSISQLAAAQQRFFAGGTTRDLDFRLAQLKKLKEALKAREAEFLAALHQDLHKHEFEAYTSEVGFVYEEINQAMRNLRRWAKPKRTRTPITNELSRSWVQYEPRGVVLIIGPWNYPVQLILSPLVAAIAAGNCAVLKPSELAPHTALLIERFVKEVFAPEYCTAVCGGPEVTTQLLKIRFDHIFFTGSIPVGKIVMRAAAEHLTPVTLELGGKSPCIVERDADLVVTARRIVWGKFYNAGQTCIAPDYLLVHQSVKAELLREMQRVVREFFGDDPQKSTDFGRIINERNFERLQGLLKDGTLVFGGQHDKAARYIAPTILDQVSLSSPIMSEEVFGPILPVIGYEDLNEALDVVRQRAHPLALYLFTKNPATQKRVIHEVPFGGGCINNALIHVNNPHLPFGGVGPSGLGAYHGHYGFETFSHRKAITKTSVWFDLKFKYPPYRGKLGFLRWLIR